MMRAPLLLALLLSSTALAAAKPKVVVDADGAIHPLLTRALKNKFTPVAAKSALPDQPSAMAATKAAREAGAVALVTAHLSGGSWEVVVLNGADGQPLEQFKIKAPPPKKPLKALPKGTDKRLEKALAGAKAPAKEEVKKKDEPKKGEPVAAADEQPSKEEPKEEVKPPPKKKGAREVPPPPPPPALVEPEAPVAKVEEPAPEAPPAPVADTSAKPVALNIGVGFKLFSRRFYYNQDLFAVLSKYSLKLGPALQLEADWYPGAHFTRGVAAHLGLSFGLSYAVGISSVATDGTKYPTTALRLRVGVQGRIPVGPIELYPRIGYAMQSYSISGATKPNIPDVGYSLIRAGLGTRISIVGPLGLALGFAYQHPLSTGQISSAAYFPRSTAGGLDADFGVVIGPLFKRLEIRLGGEYIRYWYAMNPEPGDPYIAGGALDDYVGGSLMVAFVL